MYDLLLVGSIKTEDSFALSNLEGAVVKFKDRVTTALLDPGKEVILWPDAYRRKQIRKR